MVGSQGWLLPVAILALTTSLTTPLPDGPPLSACIDMNPGTQVGTIGMEGHTSLPKNYQPGTPSRKGPYFIEIHDYVDHYELDRDYRVSIVANQTLFLNYYKGVLLEARKVVCAGSTVVRVEEEPLGTFTVPSSSRDTMLKTMDCNEMPRSALAHRSRQLKTNESAIWRSPSDITGPIVFRMTIVKAATEYWTEQHSIIMLDSTGEKPRTCGATSVSFTFSMLFLVSIVYHTILR